MCPFPIYPLYTRTVILSLDKPIADCFLFRPRKRLEKRKKRSHTNVSNASLIRTSTLPAQTAHVCFHSRKRVHTRLSEKDGTQRLTRRNRSLPSPGHSTVLCCQRNSFCSATLLYTYISRFSVTPHYQQQFYLRPSFITFFNFSHKRPTFAFTSESGYTHSALLKGSHTAAHTAKHGAFRMGVVSLPSDRSARSRTSPGRVPERRALPLLGLGRGCSQRTQRAFGTAMRSCVSLFRGVAAPLGCVIFFAFVEIAVFTPCA